MYLHSTLSRCSILQCTGVLTLYNFQVYLHCTMFKCTYVLQCTMFRCTNIAQCSGVHTLYNVQVYLHCTMFRCTYIVQFSGVLTFYMRCSMFRCTNIAQCSGVHTLCNVQVYNVLHALFNVQVYNQRVCNCHEDSSLLSILDLVEVLHSSSDTTTTNQYWHRLQVQNLGVHIFC